jgi:hypothetical protein
MGINGLQSSMDEASIDKKLRQSMEQEIPYSSVQFIYLSKTLISVKGSGNAS